MKDFIIRKAKISDMKEVLSMIKELANYEKAEVEVHLSLEKLIKDGFGDQKLYEALVVETKGKLCGYAIYYNAYSTWKGRAFYLEDIFVRKEFRNKGIGEKLFKQVIKIAIKRKAKRVDWQILKWNSPAINFYKKMRSTFDDEWINGRLFELDLNNFSKNKENESI